MTITAGSRVCSKSFGRQFGTVVSVAEKTAMVQWDWAQKQERCYLEKLTLETAADIAKREHAAAMRAWREAMPKIELAHLEHDSRWGRTDVGGTSVIARTPEQMRQAADELRLLAYWFETKPKEIT